uniref:Uncharacterized protein n=1 Tax=Arundo donax TaxID=35708 RepID=A0A0A9B1C5_ARUDO
MSTSCNNIEKPRRQPLSISDLKTL